MGSVLKLASTSLHAARRERDLAALAAGEVVDVLVVGGGVTGAGVALDAASRGLSVALVERDDLASGTSRWSSKLVHGGLRYLTHGAAGVAMESATERALLMQRTAPHLVRALPMVLPVNESVSRWEASLALAGMSAGDALRLAARTRRSTLPRPRRLPRPETLRLAPALRADGLRGGLLTWEGQLTDDARLVVAIARTAAGFGARIVPRCSATAVSGDGAQVRDELTGQSHEIRARAVINAAGVWATQLAGEVRLRPSRGTHLVVPAERLGNAPAAVMVPVPGERGRFVFTLPEPGGYAYVGLTDEPVTGEPDEELCPDAGELDFLLRTVNSALATPLERSDVLATFSGLRPLLWDPSRERSADISRRHAVLTGTDGVVTVVGGKLTTYRRMAADAVDAAVAAGRLPAGRCVTARTPLVGSAPLADLDSVRAPRRLVERYGTEAPSVLAEARTQPELLRPVADGLSVTGAELAFGVRHEGALGAEDLLDRRTRIGLVPADRGTAADAAADIAAAYLPASETRLV